VGANQRTRIEMAMVELAGRDGYENVTVRKLASTAHVSTGTFYSHFRGTDQCFLEVHKALVDRIRERIKGTRASSLGRREQAALSLSALARALGEDPVSSRVILTEVFAGGPAALGSARDCERLLATALKESLDRRGERVPFAVTTWIIAGMLHRARSTAGIARRSADEDMVRWGLRVISDGMASERMPARAIVRLDGRIDDGESSGGAHGDEAGLLLAAAKRLAMSDGYHKLTLAKIASAAGLSTTSFKRHFGSVEAIYLEVARRLAARLVACPSSGREHDHPRQQGIDIHEVCQRVAADPAIARIAFLDVVEPGPQGLSCRTELITRVAAQCDPVRRDRRQQADPTTEAAVAALWATVAEKVARGESAQLPKTAPTLSRLFAIATPTASSL
jgi:AcrR family transcriptional regulator